MTTLKSKTYVSYILPTGLGPPVGPSYTDLEPRAAVDAMVADVIKSGLGLMSSPIGFIISQEVDDQKSRHNFFFARCADDILLRDKAKLLAAEWKTFPAADVKGKRAHIKAALVEERLAEYGSVSAFLLKTDNRGVAVIPLHAGDKVINAATAEFYSFPEMPTGQAAGNSGSTAQPG
jgi:hypothetical protein